MAAALVLKTWVPAGCQMHTGNHLHCNLDSLLTLGSLRTTLDTEAEGRVAARPSCSATLLTLFFLLQAGSELAMWLNETLVHNSSACTTALGNLTTCANDTGNSTTSRLSSLQIQQGCCSTACAAAVEQVQWGLSPRQ